MEQELIRELNKRIIGDFEQAVKDLDTRIITFEETRDKGNLDGEILIALKEIIVKMKEIKDKLNSQIKQMREEDEKGISLFQLKGTKYEEKFNVTSDKLEEIDKDIVGAKERVAKADELPLIKKMLERRVRSLEKKKGIIKNRQSKIVDKATKDKLSKYLEEIKKSDKVAGIVAVNNKNINKSTEKMGSLTGKKEQLSELRKELLSSKNLIEKGIGVNVMFNEKLTDARIKRLQAKQGVVKFANKQVVKRGVMPSIITKMKDKVKSFRMAVKSGVEAFKNSYQSSMPTATSTPTR